MTAIRRQPVATFTAGSPERGYYNDLRGFARTNHGLVTECRNPVTIAQIGLGAWQLSKSEPRWRDTVDAAVRRLLGHLDDAGHLPYDFPMAHTYPLRPPWLSAMAQGQAASLFVRAAGSDERLRQSASSVVECLSDVGSPLVTDTDDGPVLQEYPTDPPAHVLNGWIFALWGLYDVGSAGPLTERLRAMDAFHAGIDSLARRLPRYELPGHWSRYDLRDEGPVNVASPFYHQLHIAQLTAMSRLTGEAVFVDTASRWQRAVRNPITVARAITGKIRFRQHYPKRAA